MMLPERIRAYLNALVQLVSGICPLTSIVLFGSAAQGSFSGGSSDVDLFLVVPDDTTAEHRRRLHDAVLRLEIEHGFRAPSTRKKNFAEKLAERAGGNANACFICTRSALLSGDAGRVFDLRPIENFFVDRIVLASAVVSAITISGEDLLPRVSLPPLRRLDVFKALFSFANMSLASAAGFLVFPDATKYAMGALKHSLHSCYFCYNLHTASLDEEISFFSARLGHSSALARLLELRRNHQRSFAFVLLSAPVILRLHFRTAFDNRFPRAVPSRPANQVR